jgi:hypothetical protein
MVTKRKSGRVYLTGFNSLLHNGDGKLLGRLYALVAEEDYERIRRHRWYLHTNGYAFTNMQDDYNPSIKYPVLMHRFILGDHECDGQSVHHRDGNKLHNQRWNLMVMPQNRAENAESHLAPSRR